MEEIKQDIVKALVSGYGMTEEDAEDKIYNSDELDGGIGVELMEELLDEEVVEFEVIDLLQDSHSFDMNIGDGLVMVIFHERPNVAAVDKSFERYEASPISERLRIENVIESEEDQLILAYDIKDDLKEDLMQLFELLKSQACKQLLDSVLNKEHE